jgi:hypothetical protein
LAQAAVHLFQKSLGIKYIISKRLAAGSDGKKVKKDILYLLNVKSSAVGHLGRLVSSVCLSYLPPQNLPQASYLGYGYFNAIRGILPVEKDASDAMLVCGSSRVMVL